MLQIERFALDTVRRLAPVVAAVAVRCPFQIAWLYDDRYLSDVAVLQESQTPRFEG